MTELHHPVELHRDAGDAARVAWKWIDALAVALVRSGADRNFRFEITTNPFGLDRDQHSSLEAVVLWRGTTVFAAAFLVRDQMNFTQLVRWQAEDVF